MKNTVIFIHGMFQNPKSWENWIKFFKARDYECIAPAWPMHDGEPADLRSFPPEDLGGLELQSIVNLMEDIATSAGEKPIVIGHSVGGLIAQLLVNRGFAKMGIAINSVAPNAMLTLDWGFMKNSALIANPFKGDDPFVMDPESFHSSFTNTLSAGESDALWSKYAVNDSRNVLRDCMGEDGELDVESTHAPLLFIGGSEDQIIPPSLNQKNAEAYTDEESITEFKEFPARGHAICIQPGWEEVAEYVATWLSKNEKFAHQPAESFK
ncbi:alpha/beta hydrolase [Mucilaginibacter sp. dw_454]|uniref:alpha/beta hydrolase n=1 Tax=Mucilaginibacter sp. dw_454 TaxID=2720079 RepID=UPI001BD5E94D|nr:alpha/beta hydrolase [Mucilaginibacter sp. dw_454]